MGQIKKTVIGINVLVIIMLLGACGEKQSISKGVGNYVMDEQHYGKKFSSDNTLTITHLEGNRYSCQYFKGGSLRYDDINIIKDTHIYDLKETQSVGSFSADFSTVKARNKTYNKKK